MSTIPNITVTGWSNSGKTTFVTQVVKILADSGIKVAVIKHHGAKQLGYLCIHKFHSP